MRVPSGFALRGPGLAIAAVVVVGAIIAAVVLSGGKEAQASEVLLEAATSTGQDPFIDIEAQPDPPFAQPEIEPPTPPPDPQVQGPNGYVPLYGGSGVLGSCYRERLIAFLEANPTHASAWASVIGIAPSEIGSYVREELHSLKLNVDLRVTNHGLVNGVASPFQSVLQAGTAVLVDAEGIPRVRCKCGNPLTPAAPVQGTPVYIGTRWPTFDPTILVSIGVEEPTATVTATVTPSSTPITTATGGFGDLSGAPIAGTYEFGSATIGAGCEGGGDPDDVLGDLVEVELPVEGIVVFSVGGESDQADLAPDGTFAIISEGGSGGFFDLEFAVTGRLGGGRLEFYFDFGEGCQITLPATIIG